MHRRRSIAVTAPKDSIACMANCQALIKNLRRACSGCRQVSNRMCVHSMLSLNTTPLKASAWKQPAGCGRTAASGAWYQRLRKDVSPGTTAWLRSTITSAPTSQRRLPPSPQVRPGRTRKSSYTRTIAPWDIAFIRSVGACGHAISNLLRTRLHAFRVLDSIHAIQQRRIARVHIRDIQVFGVVSKSLFTDRDCALV